MYTLLIVDDDPKIIEGMKRIIDWKNFGVTRIETAVSCAEALARAVDCKPDISLFDVCIGFDYGYDLIKRLNSLDIRSNYIMMSGYGEFQYACEAIRCGAVDYLLKPVAVEKLESCVTKIVMERLHGTLEPCQAPESDPVLGMAYSSFPPLINKILTMVRAEYGENISLKSLADRFRMNSTYLGQLFIQETRMKFSEYLMLFRMHEAYERICTTDDKIGDIAAAVGYSNVNYFYQHFHIYNDQSPSEIRAQHARNGVPRV